MQPGEDYFQFMVEIDRLGADLHKLVERSITEQRKCVIIVAKLSADYEIEVRMLDNNPAGLERSGIECVIGNQYNRLLRQQDLNALSPSGGTTTADRGEKKRRTRHRFEGNCFNCGRVTALRITRVRRRRYNNQEMPPPTRRAEVGGNATSVPR